MSTNNSPSLNDILLEWLKSKGLPYTYNKTKGTLTIRPGKKGQKLIEYDEIGVIIERRPAKSPEEAWRTSSFCENGKYPTPESYPNPGLTQAFMKRWRSRIVSNGYIHPSSPTFFQDLEVWLNE